MQVNNVQKQSFGRFSCSKVALENAAKENSPMKRLWLENIKRFSKDTEYFDVYVNDDLVAQITSKEGAPWEKTLESNYERIEGDKYIFSTGRGGIAQGYYDWKYVERLNNGKADPDGMVRYNIMYRDNEQSEYKLLEVKPGDVTSMQIKNVLDIFKNTLSQLEANAEKYIRHAIDMNNWVQSMLE